MALTRRLSIALGLVTAAWSPSAAAQNEPTPSLPLAWLDEHTADAVAAGIRQALSVLQPAQHRDYLQAIGIAFYDDRPNGLEAAARRGCVLGHEPVLEELARRDPALVAWFALAAVDYLVAGNDCQGAIEILDLVDRLAPDADAYRFERCSLRVDCLAELQHLAAADRACADAEKLQLSDLQRTRLVAQRGSVNVMLGRLDQASRELGRADQLLASVTTSTPDDEARLNELRFEAFLRRLDLLTAREQFDQVHAAGAEFAAQRQQSGQPLSAAEHDVLAVHDVSADYYATQYDEARIDPTLDRLQALAAADTLSKRRIQLLTIWATDLELRRGRLDAARSMLQRLPTSSLSPRFRWLLAPIAAELARVAGADPPTLAQHEATLRGLLSDMIGEWREVSWQRETTGFLRLGSRLRILTELIAVTLQLHGPERALQHVLDVQCCTTVSRARGVEPQRLTDLRERLLPPGHGAIVFVPAWNGSHAFAFDRDGIAHADLPRASSLRHEVEALLKELQSLPDGGTAALAAVRARSQALSTMLLPANIRDRLVGWQHVIITGGSLLGGLPSECLMVDGRLLGERFAITTGASLPLAAKLRRSASGRSAQLSARMFATMTPAPGFAERNAIAGPTVSARARLQPWLAELPPDTNPQLDEAATVAAWLSSCRSQPCDLQILLAHGEQPFDGLPPALGLSPDASHPEGTLTPAEITATQQHGMVVLAACHAARGPARLGDDDVAATLAGAFLFAGADAVVASAAPLRLGLYVDLGIELTEALRAGVCPAEAMRRARVAAADGDAVRAFLCAQVTLVGWGGDPLAEPPLATTGWRHLALLLGLSSALVGGWMSSRRYSRRAQARRQAAAGEAAGCA